MRAYTLSFSPIVVNYCSIYTYDGGQKTNHGAAAKSLLISITINGYPIECNEDVIHRSPKYISAHIIYYDNNNTNYYYVMSVHRIKQNNCFKNNIHFLSLKNKWPPPQEKYILL